MTRNDLAQMSRDELIDLILAEHTQLETLRADYEALKVKLEKGKKPPMNSDRTTNR